MNPLRMRRFFRRSKTAAALIALLLALAGGDLIHHLAIAHAGSHDAADACLAVVGGIAFAVAAAAAVAVLSLPRPSYRTATGATSLCPSLQPVAAARAGPVSAVVLRL